MKFSLLMVGCIFFSCTEAPKNNDSRGGNGNNPREPQKPAIKTQLLEDLPSQISRTRGAEQKSYKEIRQLIKDGNLDDKDLRIIPVPEFDNTGETIKALPPLKPCGLASTLDSIKDRITNCVTENKDRNLWNGKENGNAGEANWTLVANSIAPDFSIWLDERTGLIWSHSIARTEWKYASGAGVKASEFVCGNLAVFPLEQVDWRLPTRNEFLQADIDGSKGVNYDVADGTLFWSATTSKDFDDAWAIDLVSGILTSLPKGNLLDVKCVGEIIK